MILELPVDSTVPSYDFEVDLEGATYIFAFDWNRRAQSWFMSIASADGTPLVSNRRVSLGADLIGPGVDPLLPPGRVLAVDTSAASGDTRYTSTSPYPVKLTAGIDPGRYDLGDRVRILYFEQADVLEIADEAEAMATAIQTGIQAPGGGVITPAPPAPAPPPPLPGGSPPTIFSFLASPTSAYVGTPIMLSWTVSNDAATLTIDHAVGDVTGLTSVSVTPAVGTYTYTLTATNAFGSVTSSVSVTVQAVPVVTVGTGTTYSASYVTVTGAGAMPSWTTNTLTTTAVGDGLTDATAQLQADLDAAYAAGKALLIPATTAFYKIGGVLLARCSVVGVNGTPTIKQVNASTAFNTATMFRLDQGATNRWMYNLHLTGAYDGVSILSGEQAHGIDIGNVNGLTIKGCIIEKVQGDCISTDFVRYSGTNTANNVLVDGNTLRAPWRCCIAWIWNTNGWLVVNNIIDKQVNYVSGADLEPEIGGYVQNTEIGYNQFIMNNRTALASPSSGLASGKAVSYWSPSSTPGQNIYLHHNYGTFGTGFLNAGSGWTGAFVNSENVEGSSPLSP